MTRSITEIVDASIRDGKVYRREMIDALTAREDEIADELRLMGAQLGTFPELVAKALMDAGLGTPPPAEQQKYINQQFSQRLEWLQEQFRKHNGE